MTIIITNTITIIFIVILIITLIIVRTSSGGDVGKMMDLGFVRLSHCDKSI